MMNRRAFLVAVAAPLGLPNGTAAQQTRHALPRVGVLTHTTDPEAPIAHVFEDSLREGLRESGFVEGQTVEIDYRWGALEDLPHVAAEMLRSNVDGIFTGGTPAGLAAKKSTSTIPIVVAAMADPVADGLVSQAPIG